MVWTGTTFTTQMLQQSLDQSGEWEGCSWVPWRYLFNSVSFSYEMAWWDWPQWEYIIDWASLQGINLPLAIGGQEMCVFLPRLRMLLMLLKDLGLRLPRLWNVPGRYPSVLYGTRVPLLEQIGQLARIMGTAVEHGLDR